MAQCHNTNNEVIVDLKQLYIEDGSVSQVASYLKQLYIEDGSVS